MRGLLIAVSLLFFYGADSSQCGYYTHVNAENSFTDAVLDEYDLYRVAARQADGKWFMLGVLTSLALAREEFPYNPERLSSARVAMDGDPVEISGEIVKIATVGLLTGILADTGEFTTWPVEEDDIPRKDVVQIVALNFVGLVLDKSGQLHQFGLPLYSSYSIPDVVLEGFVTEVFGSRASAWGGANLADGRGVLWLSSETFIVTGTLEQVFCQANAGCVFFIPSTKQAVLVGLYESFVEENFDLGETKVLQAVVRYADWGHIGVALLGNGTVVPLGQSTPQVPELPKKVKQIFMSESSISFAAIDEDDKLHMWGERVLNEQALSGSFTSVRYVAKGILALRTDQRLIVQEEYPGALSSFLSAIRSNDRFSSLVGQSDDVFLERTDGSVIDLYGGAIMPPTAGPLRVNGRSWFKIFETGGLVSPLGCTRNRLPREFIKLSSPLPDQVASTSSSVVAFDPENNTVQLIHPKDIPPMIQDNLPDDDVLTGVQKVHTLDHGFLNEYLDGSAQFFVSFSYASKVVLKNLAAPIKEVVRYGFPCSLVHLENGDVYGADCPLLRGADPLPGIAKIVVDAGLNQNSPALFLHQDGTASVRGMADGFVMNLGLLEAPKKFTCYSNEFCLVLFEDGTLRSLSIRDWEGVEWYEDMPFGVANTTRFIDVDAKNNALAGLTELGDLYVWSPIRAWGDSSEPVFLGRFQGSHIWLSNLKWEVFVQIKPADMQTADGELITVGIDGSVQKATGIKQMRLFANHALILNKDGNVATLPPLPPTLFGEAATSVDRLVLNSDLSRTPGSYTGLTFAVQKTDGTFRTYKGRNMDLEIEMLPSSLKASISQVGPGNTLLEMHDNSGGLFISTYSVLEFSIHDKDTSEDDNNNTQDEANLWLWIGAGGGGLVFGALLVASYHFYKSRKASGRIDDVTVRNPKHQV